MEHVLIYGESATGKTTQARQIIDKYLEETKGLLLIYDYKAVDYIDYGDNPKRLFCPIRNETQQWWFIHFLESALKDDREILIVIDAPTPHLINKEKDLIAKLMVKQNITVLLVLYDYERLDPQITKLFKKVIHKDRINRRK